MPLNLSLLSSPVNWAIVGVSLAFLAYGIKIILPNSNQS